MHRESENGGDLPMFTLLMWQWSDRIQASETSWLMFPPFYLAALPALLFSFWSSSVQTSSWIPWLPDVLYEISACISSFLFKIYLIVWIYAWAWGYIYISHVCSSTQRPEGVRFPVTGVAGGMSYPLWVPGTEPRSSDRAAIAFQHCDIFQPDITDF